MTLRFGTFCSGIASPEVAWRPFGWDSRWMSEVDPFASAVLAHRLPSVRNLGDMTKIGEEIEPVDLVCAGTPCQSFSVAGLRAGLADPRGNLALVFLRLIDQIRPRWMVWENVAGVLSSNEGRDFGAFVGALGKLGYGWAYRVLDAQYFGVPQRRRRVFVVGYFGDWRCASAVLFERHSLSGDHPPSREAGQGASGGANGRLACHNQSVTHTLRGEGFDASEDGTGRGTPIIPVVIQEDKQNGITIRDTAGSLRANAPGSQSCGSLVGEPIPIDMRQASRGGTMTNNRSDDVSSGGAPGTGIGKAGDPSPTIAGSHVPAIAIQERAVSENLDNGPGGKGWQEDVAYTLEARHHVQMVGTALAVRRFTPRECERLQGFPDEWTLVPYRGGLAKDGPRYKAIGNSMAVPTMQWIGQRILLAALLTINGRQMIQFPAVNGKGRKTISLGHRKGPENHAR